MSELNVWQSTELRDLVEIDPEVLRENTDRDYHFHYVDIASVSEGRVDMPSFTIPFRGSPSRARKVVRRGDVLMSTVRPNLKAFAYFDYPYDDCVASTGFAVLRAKQNVDPRFVLYSILSEPVTRQIESLIVGSNYPAINSTAVSQLKVLTPTATEQTKIADVLATVDQAIEQTEALIAKQQRIKTGLMQDLLTKGIDEHGNLRSETTHEFKDSPLGRIPVEWNVIQLSKIADVSSGLTLGKTHSGPNTVELPYLRVANVQDGYLDLSDVTMIRVPNSYVAKYQLLVGDVLMNEGGDFDKLGRGTVWRGEIDSCLHQNHVFKVRPNSEKLESEYLAAISASPYGKAFFMLASKQSTNLASINSTQLKSFPIPLPPLPEQKALVELVRAQSETLESSQQERRKLASLKTALMQDLLTGKKRVSPLLKPASTD